MHVSTYVHKRICMYACTYVHKYIHTHLQKYTHSHTLPLLANFVMKTFLSFMYMDVGPNHQALTSFGEKIQQIIQFFPFTASSQRKFVFFFFPVNPQILLLLLPFPCNLRVIHHAYARRRKWECSLDIFLFPALVLPARVT